MYVKEWTVEFLYEFIARGGSHPGEWFQTNGSMEVIADTFSAARRIADNYLSQRDFFRMFIGRYSEETKDRYIGLADETEGRFRIHVFYSEYFREKILARDLPLPKSPKDSALGKGGYVKQWTIRFNFEYYAAAGVGGAGEKFQGTHSIYVIADSLPAARLVAHKHLSDPDLFRPLVGYSEVSQDRYTGICENQSDKYLSVIFYPESSAAEEPGPVHLDREEV